MSLPAGPPLVANPSDTCLHEECTAWSLQGFQLFSVIYPHTVVLETLIDNVKLKFFF